MEFLPTEHQHRRYNPLTGKWILVCPHRMLRPWSGQQEPPVVDSVLERDPSNPLCPNAIRANGVNNPNYTGVFTFENDFPALFDDTPKPPLSSDPLFQMAPAHGNCRVMCFHPKSNITLPRMAEIEIIGVINEWINQFNELSAKYNWVQIFENKGAAMGCSNPHPHCQIWACSFLPSEPQEKDKNLLSYYQKYGKPLLTDYCDKELQRNERVVLNNPDWLVLVPYWASWPFETMIISRNNNKRLSELTSSQVQNLAEVIKKLTTKYDNLFQCTFPYSMGWQGAPTGNLLTKPNEHWTLHAIYYPPLLRSASIRKFMVGFELLCEAQRDLTAEQAAEMLRAADGNKHFMQ